MDIHKLIYGARIGDHKNTPPCTLRGDTVDSAEMGEKVFEENTKG